MTMPRKILDQMYWSGFCDEAIMHTEQTDFALGGPERVAWMQEHAPKCEDCLRATKFKNMEFSVAQDMGERAVTAFHMGSSSLTMMPGYLKGLQKVLNEAIASGALTKEDVTWMAKMANRHGTPWPKLKSKKTW